nr:NAD(P)H-binding protein [Chroococcidiopsis sp. CCNUC1]
MTAALILVAGATGGVGQLAVAKALEKGFTVRVLTRQADKAKQMFGDRVEIAVGDIRQPNTLPAAVTGCNAHYLLYWYDCLSFCQVGFSKLLLSPK